MVPCHKLYDAVFNLGPKGEMMKITPAIKKRTHRKTPFPLQDSHSFLLFATLPPQLTSKLSQFVLYMAKSYTQWLSFNMPPLLVPVCNV